MLTCGMCDRRASDGACGIDLMDDWDAPSYPDTHRCHNGYRPTSRKSLPWPVWEDNVIREYYTRYGIAWCARNLRRTPDAIKKRASFLGVSFNG